MRIKENLLGRGRVFLNGELVGRSRYMVTIAQEQHHARTFGHSEIVDENHSISGRFLGSDLDLYPLVGVDIVLELEDGRRWACVLVDSDGGLLNRDGLSGLPEPAAT